VLCEKGVIQTYLCIWPEKNCTSV